MNNEKISGLIIVTAVTEFFIFVNIAAFLDKGYSISNNSISHLGIDSMPYIFNASIIVLGILEMAAAFLLRRCSAAFTVLYIMGGIGSIGVGVFNEHFGYIHLSFAVLAFLFPSLLSYFAFLKYKNALSIEWSVLGTISIIALVLFGIKVYLGLGPGGMERMILIPLIAWSFQFGAFLYTKN
ncbi:DUF998 domain-containing protein [Picrophilus oshimae]|uniref:Hypothetical membrane protein n=1 Tax=Picrophilus torridus (strain ATCC 700027 / DSM 9790 / JCM 10055 / NBRC 100828 / KAW 2/3) TaxID=1122961 RepID=Q6L249_PICTO|nr:DUF998 domain-containing protein [Picrophilus oshimae]AAT42953.1 hypothetical membrane protein [Picrophilus oshimae DSM 9789]